MNLKTPILSLGILLLSKICLAQTFSPEIIQISTRYGNMKVRLFNETPKHRDNFIKLVKEHFYDSLLFHRVINGFMIQGGDPDSKFAGSDKLLGDGDLSYTIPAEIIPELCHKKGMLCAARNGDDINPGKASSGCQFYIVQGKLRDDKELKNYEKRINKTLIEKIKTELLSKPENQTLNEKISMFKASKNNDSLLYYTKALDEKINVEYEKTEHYTFKPEHQKLYKTIGGTPHLDSNYTIFGEVIEGLEVIDKIAEVATNKDDRPLTDIRMTVKLIEK